MQKSLIRHRSAIGLLACAGLLLIAAIWFGFNTSFPPAAYGGKPAGNGGGGGGGGDNGGSTTPYSKVRAGLAAKHINDRGVVVGVHYPEYAAAVSVPIDPQNGQVMLLPRLSGDAAREAALASNESGEIVGYSATGDEVSQAVLWRNGGAIGLGGLGPAADGWQSLATDINSGGQIVGDVWIDPEDFSNPPPFQFAFLINPRDADGDGEPDTWFEDQDGDGGNDLMIIVGSSARAINDSGWIAGNSGAGASVVIPLDTDGDKSPDTWFRDEDGDGINDLAVALPQGSYEGASLRDLNDLDTNGRAQVVGSLRSSDRQDAALWTVGVDGATLTKLSVPKGPRRTKIFSDAISINDVGQIVGSVEYDGPDSGDSIFFGTLWEDGSVTFLDNRLADIPANGGVTDAVSINNHAEIIGLFDEDRTDYWSAEYDVVLFPNSP